MPLEFSHWAVLTDEASKFRPGPRALNRDQVDHDAARKTKILVVDDESTIAETLVEILQEEGYEAVAASSAAAALLSAQSLSPDIVISDVIMPGQSGIELGIQLRDILPECRIILFSGQSATVDLLGDARRRGYEFDIVAKPIKPQTLLAMIRHRPGDRR
jgi:DNA-binding NtrC family response regulator